MKINNLIWLVLIGLILISLSIGASDFSWSAFFQGDESAQLVFMASRFPRTISILLAGSSMAVAGLLMQTMTQNHFAAPSTVGTVEAAQLGLLLSLFLFPNPSLFQKMVSAFVTSMIFTVLFLRVFKRLKVTENWYLPLIGIVYSGIIGSLAQILAYRFNLVQSLSSWLQGSFAMIQTHQYEWLLLNQLILLVAWRLSSSFILLSLGRDTSQTLGLDYQAIEKLALVLISLTTSVTVITVGSLPFIGVIVPNVVRLYSGDHLSRNIGKIATVGAVLVLACDMIARLVIRPYEVSVSLILGILGSASFIYLLWKGRVHA
ncbi:iron ABC transporter permease [Streptococcus merionis]|uniref:iron ABC transporter permease n=1 Tax=Streptococcus merionis TaxID=400065 RepID=UPI0026ED8B6D|nr:iron chelate uptake ABC transporter family permease subunit [Streptococcus merionis]